MANKTYYSKLLSKIISDSGLPLRTIAQRCTEMDVPITASYLSQLQSGKQNPPKEEVSDAVAKVCNYHDPTELIVYGYIEKAPELIQYLVIYGGEVIIQLMEELDLHIHGTALQRDYYKKMMLFERYERIAEFIYNSNLKSGYKPKFDLFKNFKDNIHTKYGPQVACNPFFMKDDSMDKTIPKDAKLNATRTPQRPPNSNELVIFYVNPDSTNYIVRRYKFENGKHLFVPDNLEFPIYSFDELSEVTVYGYINSYTYTRNIK